MSPSTAYKFMQIAEVYGNRPGLVDLNIGFDAISILSQNNTSDDVRGTAELMSGENDVNSVDARELHGFLEVKEHFTEWIARYLDEYGFVINSDFCGSTCLASNGRKMETYILTIDMAKELSMLSKTDKGKQARKYFIQRDKQLSEIQSGKIALKKEI